MKKRFVALMLAVMCVLCGCSGRDDSIPTLPPTKVPKQIPGAVVPEGGKWVFADSNIIVDNRMSSVVGDGMVQTSGNFYASDYSTWKSICSNTNREVVKEEKDSYDEDFFEEKMLVCAIKSASAGLEYQFEGAMYAPYNGQMVLTIYVSYSNDNVRNSLTNYFVFVDVLKSEVGQIDDIRLETFLRTK